MTTWQPVAGTSVEARSEPCAVTIGNFDGVHRGHQFVLQQVRDHAAGHQVVVVTFDPHPMAVLLPERAPLQLTTIERRVELLHEHGADEVRVLAFSREMASWTPEEFIHRVLVTELSAATVVVGENFRFGSKAAGDVGLLQRVGHSSGFTVQGLQLGGDGEPFSSSRARAAIAAGDVRAAAEVLGRPHEISGQVVRGEQRGRELGFPTANVPVDPTTAVPHDGVYAGWLDADGESLPAAISVGTNPTFGDHSRRVESYVIDREGLDLYDRDVRVSFVERLRGMETFADVDALVSHMHRDVDQARALLS